MAGREIAKAAAIIDHLGAYVRPGETVMAPVDLGALVAEVLEVAPPRPGIEVRWTWRRSAFSPTRGSWPRY